MNPTITPTRLLRGVFSKTEAPLAPAQTSVSFPADGMNRPFAAPPALASGPLPPNANRLPLDPAPSPAGTGVVPQAARTARKSPVSACNGAQT